MNGKRVLVIGGIGVMLGGLGVVGLGAMSRLGWDAPVDPAETAASAGSLPVDLQQQLTALQLAGTAASGDAGTLAVASQEAADDPAMSDASGGATPRPDAGRGAAYADEGAYFADHPDSAMAMSSEWVDRLPPAWQRYFGPDAVPAGTPSGSSTSSSFVGAS